MKNPIPLPGCTPVEREFVADHMMDAEARVFSVCLTIVKWYATAPWHLLALDKVWTRLLGPLLGALTRPRFPLWVEQWLWARRGLPSCSVNVQ